MLTKSDNYKFKMILGRNLRVKDLPEEDAKSKSRSIFAEKKLRAQ